MFSTFFSEDTGFLVACILWLFFSGDPNPLLSCWISHLQPTFKLISTAVPKSSPSRAQDNTKQEILLDKELGKHPLQNFLLRSDFKVLTLMDRHRPSEFLFLPGLLFPRVEVIEDISTELLNVM